VTEQKTRDDLLRELGRRAGMTDEQIDPYLIGPGPETFDCAIVVTCMGRLSQLRLTLPLLLERTPAPIVLVDWSCPDRCSDWASELDPKGDRIAWVREEGKRHFHKTAALNLGLRLADYNGADWLMVVDADTVIADGLWPWLERNVPGGSFAFVQGHEARRDLSGLLVMRAEHFRASGGYDERMVGWGAEDWDMRGRLHFKLGLPYVTIPWQLAEPISHDDYARTRFQDGDRMHTYKANYKLMGENFETWTGSQLHELDPRRVRPLFGGFW
jgi:hypothetical protein